jgi:hypothetical protein
METNAPQVDMLVLRVQGDFLTNPGMRLTLPQAQRRFGMDRVTCEAVLSVLVEANVLARLPDGVYTRFFPRLAHAA